MEGNFPLIFPDTKFVLVLLKNFTAGILYFNCRGSNDNIEINEYLQCVCLSSWMKLVSEKYGL